MEPLDLTPINELVSILFKTMISKNTSFISKNFKQHQHSLTDKFDLVQVYLVQRNKTEGDETYSRTIYYPALQIEFQRSPLSSCKYITIENEEDIIPEISEAFKYYAFFMPRPKQIEKLINQRAKDYEILLLALQEIVIKII